MASVHCRFLCRSSSSFHLVLYCAFFLLISLSRFTSNVKADLLIPDTEVNNWAVRFGYHLHEISKYVSFFDNVKKGFQMAGAKVEPKNGVEMVKEMSNDIEKMMAWKIQAVKRIADTAEQAMMGHKYEDNTDFEYNNAKTLNEDGGVQLTLVKDKHFYDIPVNITNSSIHVPTNVYDQATSVVDAIRWSDHLNPIFISNYHFDPSLSWQYFGSSTGFLRQYPAMKWTSQTVDTYDCRMRPWYIEAATSPKDMIILLDGSGSMTGLRNEIAKHVALNILDTLNDDDYFTIFRFSTEVEDLVPCFSGSLVPANMENIREYKKNLQNVSTEKIANFSIALTKAFELLRDYNRSGNGSMCNQAIMLITDGAPHAFEEIFNLYNQPNRHVRVFTYLIGQEMADERDVKLMACMNRGFYSHVSTLAEARDQVQHYVPVMARPMVLNKTHSVIWTSVYADIEDPKMSDWLWEKRTRELQRQHLVSYFNAIKMDSQGGQRDEEEYPNDQGFPSNKDEDSNCAVITDTSSASDKHKDHPYYRLMTTVAYPVFDPREYNDRVAPFLGVAGTDVPIDEITKLAPAYKLGVNGYAFGITNNGYVLFHPDLRPVHDGILKPDYNSVDLAEVELNSSNLAPRAEDQLLLTLRQKMIDREINHSKMSVKIHMDDSKRVVIRVNNYFYAPLKDTPFSFGIAMPDGYGMNRIRGEINLTSLAANQKSMDYERKVLSLFEGSKWSLHPDWVYCRYFYSNPDRRNRTVEETFMHFLKSNRQGAFSFKHQARVKQIPLSDDYFYEKAKQMNKDDFYCDKELIESVVFDAEATKHFGQRVQTEKKRKPCKEQTYNISNSIYSVNNLKILSDFKWKENRAIDELWYKRAVDYHYVNDKAFVFSVPFDAGLKKHSLITGSHALFLETNGRKSPAAVIGLQFDHENFTRTFLNSTTKCVNGTCKYHCLTDELNCYLLDDSGFVISSKKHDETGKFFGEIDSNIMNALVQDSIYEDINMVDYQAICFDPIQTSDASTYLLTPFVQIRNILAYVWGRLIFFYLNYNFQSWWNGALGEALPNSGQNSMEDAENDKLQYLKLVFLNKTRPKPCDKEYTLYQLQPRKFVPNVPWKGKLFCFNNQTCNKSFAVQLINDTNLLFMVVDATCKCESSSFKLEHKEIMYNEAEMCAWLKSNIYRRRPDQCTNFHIKELEIEGYCGSAIKVTIPTFFIVFLLFARWISHRFFSC